GVLDVRHPQALGGAGNGTTVDAGTALELESSINNEPLFLNGDGISFNGHFTGALRNVSNNNTYSGPIALVSADASSSPNPPYGTGVTIGVDSGTTLTITNKIDDAGNGLSLTKELTGTLVLARANIYGGATNVIQGALQVQHGQALGSTSGLTLVYDGAQLQLSGGIVVSGEALHISGTGIFGTGALQSLNGNNAWQGPITLLSQPGFSPATTPPGVVSFNAVNSGDTLTIGGAIGESAGSFGLTKIGAGTMVLKQILVSPKLP